MGKIQLCLYCIALALISTGVGEGIQKKIKFEIKALKPFHTAYECDLLDFEAAYVSCNRQPIDNWVQNQTYCHVPGNGTILEYHCVEGDWKLSTGTEYHLRERRFIGLIITLVLGIAAIGVITYCSISGCTTKAPNEYKPPKFTSCKPSDIQTVYTAGKGEKGVNVTWTEPKASGDSRIESLKRTDTIDLKSGKYFQGLPGFGYNYTIIYKAVDTNGFSASCHFTFTVKYLTCGTPPHIEYGSISNSDETIYGETRSYTCFTGYEIIGNSTVTCQQSEKWSHLPKCQSMKNLNSI